MNAPDPAAIDTAIGACRARLTADPDDVLALHQLGLLVPPGEGLALLRRAITLRPGDADLRNSLGTVHLARGEHALAFACFEHAIALQPDHDHASYHRALALHSMERFEEAAAAYARAAAVAADPMPALINRGNALVELGRVDAALVNFAQAEAVDPRHPQLLYNHGMALHLAMRLEEARDRYRRTIAADPGHDHARWNLALCDLALGDLPSGFIGMGAGLAASARYDRGFAQPTWRGEAPNGRTILLHAEAGFGDSLQFCRYAPIIQARGARVVLEVPRELMRLMTTLDGVAEIVACGAPLPPFDLHVPMLSVAGACGTTLDTIPADIPYLRADPAAVSRWRSLHQGFTVGLVWGGGWRPEQKMAHVVDSRRSMRLSQLARLGEVPGVRYVSLQKGPRIGELTTPPFPLADPTPLLADFADTAALVASLDLVISVDTAVAHLAGALGRPVWVLNRFDQCWRWLVGRTDTPWYPTMRLFRQPAPGDWPSVVDELVQALTEHVRHGSIIRPD